MTRPLRTASLLLLFGLLVAGCSGSSRNGGPLGTSNAAGILGLSIVTEGLQSAVVGEPYVATLNGFGGTLEGYGWDIIAGSAPSGITISPSGTPDATLSGTPTNAGTFTFTVALSDSAGNSTSRQLTLYVEPSRPVGTLSTAAGGSIFGPGFAGDGGLAQNATLYTPTGLALAPNGDLYIADQTNHRIRVIDATTGTIRTVAGSARGFGGDNGPATQAQLRYPAAVALDGAGGFFVADTGNQRVRHVDAAGTITTLAGTGNTGTAGDNGPADQAELFSPVALAVRNGAVYVSEFENHTVRRIDLSARTITTVAGHLGQTGGSGDGGSATQAMLCNPYGLALDTTGNLYIADQGNNRVRRVDPSGAITTVAGDGTNGFDGDGKPALQTSLHGPAAVLVDETGALLILEQFGIRLRRVDPHTRLVTTLAGSGRLGYEGDGRGPQLGSFEHPVAFAVDGRRALYLADSGNHAVRKITY